MALDLHYDDFIEEAIPEVDSDLESYNNSNVAYNTDIGRKGLPRYEEVQVRFNNLLQKRKQLDENLSGSQIAYVLDFYMSNCFQVLSWFEGREDVLAIIRVNYKIAIKAFITNRRKLFSIRYSNEEIYDVLVDLFFEQSVENFCKRFFNLKLNREVYLTFLDAVFTNEAIEAEKAEYYKFYREQYTQFKNLLLGNYLRFAFSETNKFLDSWKEGATSEIKEDYFAGLNIVILRVIDKYDSFKGTLTSFIENWFKDYRTTFKARHNLINSAADIEDEDTLHRYSAEQETNERVVSSGSDGEDFRAAMLEKLIMETDSDLTSLTAFIAKYRNYFPALSKLYLPSK